MYKVDLPLPMFSSGCSMDHYIQMIGVIHVLNIYLRLKAFAVGLLWMNDIYYNLNKIYANGGLSGL